MSEDKKIDTDEKSSKIDEHRGKTIAAAKGELPEKLFNHYCNSCEKPVESRFVEGQDGMLRVCAECGTDDIQLVDPEYLDGGSDRLTTGMLIEIYKGNIAALTDSLKHYAKLYHHEHCGPSPFSICQNSPCKEAEGAINAAIHFVAGGSNAQI